MPTTIAFQFRFHCPLCAESITLPRRSPVGIQEMKDYQPTLGSWPIPLICIPHEQLSTCSYDKVERIDFEKQAHYDSPAALWEIVYGCSQENCAMCYTAYTWWDYAEASTDELVGRIVKAKPTASCSSGHEIKWKPEKIRATMWPF